MFQSQGNHAPGLAAKRHRPPAVGRCRFAAAPLRFTRAGRAWMAAGGRRQGLLHGRAKPRGVAPEFARTVGAGDRGASHNGWHYAFASHASLSGASPRPPTPARSGALPAPVSATNTVTTEFETRTVWLSPVTVAITDFAAHPPYGIICANNPVNFVDPSGLCEEDGYFKRSWKQLIYGNLTDDVTALGTGAQILTGIFDLDLPGDVRDISADIGAWEWSWGHAGQTGLDIVGLLPVIGVVKYVGEAGSLFKTGQKVGGSGKAISPTVVHASRKRALDAAQAETAKGKAAIQHPAKNGQPSHYHAVDSNGNLIPTHHDF